MRVLSPSCRRRYAGNGLKDEKPPEYVYVPMSAEDPSRCGSRCNILGNFLTVWMASDLTTLQRSFRWDSRPVSRAIDTRTEHRTCMWLSCAAFCTCARRVLQYSVARCLFSSLNQANVPLLKLTDRKDNMEADRPLCLAWLPATARLQVDFCINNELGVRNSLLLNTYPVSIS